MICPFCEKPFSEVRDAIIGPYCECGDSGIRFGRPNDQSKANATPPPPRWTYSTYRAALRFDGVTVALLTPDGRNAFNTGHIAPLLALLNANPEAAVAIAGGLSRPLND